MIQPAKFIYGIRKRGAQKKIAVTFNRFFCTVHAFLFTVRNHLQKRGLPAALHIAEQLFHLFQRQRFFFKPPKFCPGVPALIKNIICIMNREIIMSKHDNQFRRISHNYILVFLQLPIYCL